MFVMLTCPIAGEIISWCRRRSGCWSWCGCWSRCGCITHLVFSMMLSWSGCWCGSRGWCWETLIKHFPNMVCWSRCGCWGWGRCACMRWDLRDLWRYCGSLLVSRSHTISQILATWKLFINYVINSQTLTGSIYCTYVLVIVLISATIHIKILRRFGPGVVMKPTQYNRTVGYG